MSDRAVILAGGLGARLRPFTFSIPKPLMPVDETPIIEILLKCLKRGGVRRATIAVNYLARIIQAHCGDGARFGLALDYSLEEKPLGTIGPLTLIADLPDHFLVANGDVLTDLDFGAFLHRHVDEDRLLTIAAFNRKQVSDYGVLEASGGRLIGFREKPALDVLVSMGVYAVSKRALAVAPRGVKFGFDDLVHALIAAGSPIAVDAHQGYWMDLGRPEDFEQAQDDARTGRIAHIIG
jgi:NDP-sugar pyrophosphorylase family protein